MNKLGGLVAIDKSKMAHKAMANMDFAVMEVLDLLKLNGTLQMDYPFHQDCSYKLDCD